MNHTVKTIITVLVVVGCVFTCLLSLGFYISETEYLEYDIAGKTAPVLKEADAEYIGDSYNGESEDGYSYYRLRVEIENNSNFGIEESFLYIYVVNTEDNFFSIREVEEDRPFDIWKEGYYFPAGKTADFYKIVRVEDGCSELDVVYKSHMAENEQRLHITF